MIYIQPSFFEDFGLTIAEAIDCGAPVITSSKSAITEVVENYAILTESHNAKEISIGIKKMIDERYFAEQLGILGRKRIEELFSFERRKTEMKLLPDGIL